MRIQADYEGRNDGYDDDVIRYYEDVRDECYLYELYVLVDGRKSRIIITDWGVSVDFKDPFETIHTNIEPNKLFLDQRSLSWNQIARIVEILEATGIEGKLYSKDEMDAMYEEWISKGEP